MAPRKQQQRLNINAYLLTCSTFGVWPFSVLFLTVLSHFHLSKTHNKIRLTFRILFVIFISIAFLSQNITLHSDKETDSVEC